QLIPPMRRNRRVGVEGKPVHTGTAETGDPWRLALGAETGTKTPDRLASPLAIGDALLDGGCHGARERGLIVEEGIIPRCHGVLDPRFEVSYPPQCADDPPTDLLDHRGNVGIGGWLALDKARLQPLVGAIEIDTLNDDHMKMDVHIECA